jgi:hypothetical protein
MRPVIEVDAKLEWSQVNPHLITLMDRLAPYGMQNPSPKFVLENVLVTAQRFMGEDERHIKLVLAKDNGRGGDNTSTLEGIIWNFGRKERFESRSPYSFVVVPGLNTFNNVSKVQLIIEDYMAPQAAKMATQSLEAAPAQLDKGLKGSTQSALQSEQSAAELTVAESGDGGPQWIDHRSRESVDVFMGQLMLPLQDRRSVLIYHEGKKPEIPFLDESLLGGRLQIRSTDELVLWDLPPSMQDFRRVLDIVKPEVIHLVGGKYQSVPIFPSEQNYLKLIVQVLRREGETITLEADNFAAQLATTTAVVTQGLILLERMGMLEIRLVEPGNAQLLQVRLLPQNANRDQDITQRLEYVAFQQALKEVGRFRGWLLKSPLATMKATLSSSLVATLPDFMTGSDPSFPAISATPVMIN